MNLYNVYLVREEKSIDKPFVLNFLEEQYFTREPLLTSYVRLHASKITPAVRETILADLRRRYELILGSCSLCLIGVQCETNRRIAVGLGILETRAQRQEAREWDQLPIASDLLALWYRRVELVAERQVDFFEMFKDVNRIMRIVMIGVDEGHEGKKVASSILREMPERSRKQGADLVYGLFTSQRMRHLADKFGFRGYADMDLSQFRDDQGNVIYNGVEPFVVSLMAIKLN